MKLLLFLSVLFGFSNSLKIQDESSQVRSTYCSECTEVRIESTGGVMDYIPSAMGRYSLAGSFWNNDIPFFKSVSAEKYLVPDAFSSPNIYYLKWVVSGEIAGMDNEIQNNEYTDGFNCPWDIPDGWEYKTDSQWHPDPTFKVVCSQFREN